MREKPPMETTKVKIIKKYLTFNRSIEKPSYASLPVLPLLSMTYGLSSLVTTTRVTKSVSFSVLMAVMFGTDNPPITNGSEELRDSYQKN